MKLIAAVLAFTILGLSGAFADNYPMADCSLTPDNSTINLTTSNGGETRYACTATCQYKITGQRPLQTFSCNFALGANAPEKITCDLDGGSANYFAELRPTKFVCQPR